VQDDAPDNEYEPAEHDTHAFKLEPEVFKYVPAVHCVHAVDPFVNEYDPAAHDTHALELDAPDAFKYVPAGQTTHTVAPLDAE